MWKEYISPIMQRKFENCCKANASRMNFGRTRPSGKVGVRERLRGQYHRSPETEEICYEMRRQKGARRLKGKQNDNSDIMKNARQESLELLEVPHTGVPRALGTSHDAQECVPARNRNESPGRRWQQSDKISREKALPPTDDEIYNHPVVMMLIERLRAKDSAQSIVGPEENNAGIEKTSTIEQNGSNGRKSVPEAHMGAHGNGRFRDNLGSRVRGRQKRGSRMA